jgi:outer membrane protein assembly factor BamB
MWAAECPRSRPYTFSVRLRPSAVALLVALSCGSSLHANWPSFRGDSARGVGTGTPPTSWDLAKGTNVAWSATIPGLGHSSPIVWGERVFITTAVAVNGKDAPPVTGVMETVGVAMASGIFDHEWRIYALDRATGRVVWQQTAYKGRPRSRHHRKSSYAAATPATDGKHVVALMGSEGLFCWDVEGRLLWRKDFGLMNVGMFDNPDTQWGPASSPVIAGDLVIVQNDEQTDSFLAAFELATGKQRWRQNREAQPSWSTPLVAQQGDRALIITSSPRIVRASELATGREVWRMEDEAPVRVPSPVLSGDAVIVTGGYPPAGRSTMAIPLASSGRLSTKAVRWRIDRGSPYTPTPLVYDNVLYVLTDGGVFSAYDAGTGTVIYHARVGAGTTGFSASPVAAGGHIYVASEDGDVYVVRAGKTPEIVATHAFKETIFATPALDGNLLIVRTRGRVIALGQP